MPRNFPADGRGEVRRVHDLAAGDVDEDGVVLHRREATGVDQAAGAGRVRRGADHDLGPRELLQETVRAVQLVDEGDHRRRVIGDAAEAEDEAGLLAQLDGPGHGAALLALEQAADVARKGQDQRQGMAGDLRPLDDAAVGEDDLRADELRKDELLAPRARAVDPDEVLHLGQERRGEDVPGTADEDLGNGPADRDLVVVGHEEAGLRKGPAHLVHLLLGKSGRAHEQDGRIVGVLHAHGASLEAIQRSYHSAKFHSFQRKPS
jgi:hypothetical protein